MNITKQHHKSDFRELETYLIEIIDRVSQLDEFLNDTWFVVAARQHERSEAIFLQWKVMIVIQSLNKE